MPTEQSRAQPIFEIADATANGRFLYADSGRSFSETAVLGRRNEITEMAKLYGV